MWVGVDLRTGTQKGTICLKEIGLSVQNMHSKLNSQHDWEDLYDQLPSTGIFTLIMNKIFI
jgi:hypothetical protein